GAYVADQWRAGDNQYSGGDDLVLSGQCARECGFCDQLTAPGERAVEPLVDHERAADGQWRDGLSIGHKCNEWFVHLSNRIRCASDVCSGCDVLSRGAEYECVRRQLWHPGGFPFRGGPAADQHRPDRGGYSDEQEWNERLPADLVCSDERAVPGA